MMPILLLSGGLDNAYFHNFGHERSYVDGHTLLIAVLAMLMFCAGAGLMLMLIPVRDTGSATSLFTVNKTHYGTGLIVMASITIAGNLAAMGPVLAQPGLVMAVLFDPNMSAGYFRQDLLKIPGITSIGNFGPLVAVLAGMKWRMVGEPLTRLERGVFVAVVITIILRSIIASERLALIECALPFMVAAYGRYEHRWSPMLSLGPVIGGGLLIGFFGLTEYFRSWTYYKNYYDSFWSFITERLTGYYMTAINNGAGIFTNFPPNGEPLITLQWFYKFPLFPWAGSQDTQVVDFLTTFANVEFNNSSGIFAPINDMGPTVGILIWFLIGLLSGALFQGYRNGGFISSLVYPTWIVGIYEILRVLYWGNTRYFPIMLATAAFLLLVARQRSREYNPITSSRAHPLAPMARRPYQRRV